MSATSLHYTFRKTNLLRNFVHVPGYQIVAVRMVQCVEAVGVAESDEMRFAREEVEMQYLKAANLRLSRL